MPRQVSGTGCQALPFQRRIGGEPTAQARPDDRTETPASPPQPGIGTTCPEVPSQCSASISPLVLEPTAQALPADEALTASRKSPSGAGGVGLGVRLHRAPFQCRITVSPELDVRPMAQAFLAEMAVTPARKEVCPARAGVATRRH